MNGRPYRVHSGRPDDASPEQFSKAKKAGQAKVILRF